MMQSRITVAKMPPVMTTVPAVIRPLLHQQPATHATSLTAPLLPHGKSNPGQFGKLRKLAERGAQTPRGMRAGGRGRRRPRPALPSLPGGLAFTSGGAAARGAQRRAREHMLQRSA